MVLGTAAVVGVCLLVAAVLVLVVLVPATVLLLLVGLAGVLQVVESSRRVWG